MATVTISPNMGLTVPVAGQESGPTWALDLNNSLGIVDAHNHSVGQGVQINPNGININANLPFNSNALTNAGYLNISPQGTGVPLPVNASIYVSGTDLYYKNGSGVAVQITLAGSVNATSSGISSGTAMASFVSSVLTVIQNVGIAAPVDAASYILRYNGSYPTPSGNAIVLAAPASLSGTYQMTLPGAAPGANNAFLVENTTGNVSYVNTDNTTLQVSGTSLQVAPLGINTAQLTNNGVTQGKLALRAVGPSATAGNVALTSSCGNFVTSNTSMTLVSNLQATITTTGRPVRVFLQADGTATSGAGQGGYVSIRSQTGGNSFQAELAFFRGATNINQTTLSGLIAAGTTFNPCPVESFGCVDFVAAGTYTYSFQVYNQYGGLGGTTTVNNAVLVAYEI